MKISPYSMWMLHGRMLSHSMHSFFLKGYVGVPIDRAKWCPFVSIFLFNYWKYSGQFCLLFQIFLLVIMSFFITDYTVSSQFHRMLLQKHWGKVKTKPLDILFLPVPTAQQGMSANLLPFPYFHDTRCGF